MNECTCYYWWLPEHSREPLFSHLRRADLPHLTLSGVHLWYDLIHRHRHRFRWAAERAKEFQWHNVLPVSAVIPRDQRKPLPCRRLISNENHGHQRLTPPLTFQQGLRKKTAKLNQPSHADSKTIQHSENVSFILCGTPFHDSFTQRWSIIHASAKKHW